MRFDPSDDPTVHPAQHRTPALLQKAQGLCSNQWLKRYIRENFH
jgi:hypothetical protein